jgi:hypothetical protein
MAGGSWSTGSGLVASRRSGRGSMTGAKRATKVPEISEAVVIKSAIEDLD